jgi:CRP-like cAMP-binding protein
MPAKDPVAALLLKLRIRDEVSEREADVLRSAIGEVQTFPTGKTLVRLGAPVIQSTLLIDGMVSRYRDMKDGQRQIMELHVAGDFVDLHGFLLKRLDHNIGTMTPVTVGFVPHQTLARITQEEPHLSRMLWLSTLMDASIQREHILSMGRRAALARIGHLMCELCIRFEVIGLAEDRSFALPLTQLDIADATGLTSIHVNRMLKQLREQKLLTFRGGRVQIHDWEGLQTVSDFDPTYLHLERQPR